MRQTGMRTVIATLIAVVLAACGSGHDAGNPPGTVQGHVGLFGGPLNPETGKMALSDAPQPGVAVTATSVDRRVVARTTTDAAGHFTLHLAAGRYSIAPECGAAQTLVVASGQADTIALQCAVP